jgi:hypothetical protein
MQNLKEDIYFVNEVKIQLTEKPLETAKPKNTIIQKTKLVTRQ